MGFYSNKQRRLVMAKLNRQFNHSEIRNMNKDKIINNFKDCDHERKKLAREIIILENKNQTLVIENNKIKKENRSMKQKLRWTK